MADEPVVVSKFPPKKPGDGVEDKTETTRGMVREGRRKAKSADGCEGAKFNRKSSRAPRAAGRRTSRPTGRASGEEVPPGTGIFKPTALAGVGAGKRLYIAGNG